MNFIYCIKIIRELYPMYEIHTWTRFQSKSYMNWQIFMTLIHEFTSIRHKVSEQSIWKMICLLPSVLYYRHLTISLKQYSNFSKGKIKAVHLLVLVFEKLVRALTLIQSIMDRPSSSLMSHCLHISFDKGFFFGKLILNKLSIK